jgi:hypothetical protein
MKEQRLVHTILTGGAEDYEVPRVRSIKGSQLLNFYEEIV